MRRMAGRPRFAASISVGRSVRPGRGPRQHQHDAAGAADRQPIAGPGVARQGDDIGAIRPQGDGPGIVCVPFRLVGYQIALLVEHRETPPLARQPVALQRVFTRRMQPLALVVGACLPAVYRRRTHRQAALPAEMRARIRIGLGPAGIHPQHPRAALARREPRAAVDHHPARPDAEAQRDDHEHNDVEQRVERRCNGRTKLAYGRPPSPALARRRIERIDRHLRAACEAARQPAPVPRSRPPGGLERWPGHRSLEWPAWPGRLERRRPCAGQRSISSALPSSRPA